MAGNFSLSGEELRFSQAISTKRACVDAEIQKIENDFLKALEEVDGFRIESGILRLKKGDQTVLTLSGDANP